jgi:two-component system sensor histidine kinase KdpD
LRLPSQTNWNPAARRLSLAIQRRAGDGAPGSASLSTVSAILIPGAATLLMVALATAVIFISRDILPILNIVSFVYLIPVVTAAVRWGIGPATLAAAAGALAADFFFYPPLYNLRIDDPQNIADLIAFLIVAIVCGSLAASLRRREREIHNLYGYSRRLAACFTASDLIQATQDYLSQYLGYPTILIGGRDLDDQSHGVAALPEKVRRIAAAMISSNEHASRTVWEDASGHIWLVRSVSLGTAQDVVCVNLGTHPVFGNNALNRRIDAVTTEAAENLVRLDLAKALEDANMEAQADALRNALVATMSHELRTPLVSILGAASVLDQMAVITADAQARTLVDTIHGEAARLDSDIRNLLDAARISAGVGRHDAELTDPVDIVHAAIGEKSAQLAGHRLAVSLAPDLPMVEVQTGLVENALAQLLDNAAKYSSAGSTI